MALLAEENGFCTAGKVISIQVMLQITLYKGKNNAENSGGKGKT